MPGLSPRVGYGTCPGRATGGIVRDAARDGPTSPGRRRSAAPPPPRFGVKDVFDLSWRNLLDAYSCTECGRCSAACPANLTGKALSPRKIMMSTRDRLEEVGRNIDANGQFTDDGKSLLNYITVEELRACTTCNACVTECPVSISPLEIIIEMRRALIMEDSNARRNGMHFSEISRTISPPGNSVPTIGTRWTTEG